MTLSYSVKNEVERLLAKLDMPNCYRSYQWKTDTWETGFPDLFTLEREISLVARNNSLDRTHLLKIAEWGDLPNKKAIFCQNPIKITLYVNGSPAMWLKNEPENAVLILDGKIRGFGPTYCSKVLHFAVPQVFGALDTRLVRTFGEGDPASKRYHLLNLVASGERWAISSSQPGWPGEYGTWCAILNYIADTLNQNGTACPLPSKYLESGLRKDTSWLPADVETALFSYASKVVETKD